jgi:methylenetetrahydrofolate reductase (NADPH)
MAANAHGDFFSDADSTSAVTWGVFPGAEIKQPLVVCADGFRAWAEEAFELWSTMWGAVVEDGSDAAKLLTEVQQNWFLVSLLENDFVSGDVFRSFAA